MSQQNESNDPAQIERSETLAAEDVEAELSGPPTNSTFESGPTVNSPDSDLPRGDADPDPAESAGARSAVHPPRADPKTPPESPRGKPPQFRMDWVRLCKIELKESTDPSILAIINSLHPCAEDDLLIAKGVVPLFGIFPPQGYFRGDTFVVVFDWGEISRARRLLDEQALVPVVVHRSAAAAKPIALHQLAVYHELTFTPNREDLRARIATLYDNLSPGGTEHLRPTSKAYLAWVSGRRESVLRPSERGRKRSLKRDPVTSPTTKDQTQTTSVPNIETKVVDVSPAKPDDHAAPGSDHGSE